MQKVTSFSDVHHCNWIYPTLIALFYTLSSNNPRCFIEDISTNLLPSLTVKAI